MQPDLLGNRLERPALLRQMADLLIAPAPVGTARGHPVGETREGSSLGQRGRAGALMTADWSVPPGEARGRHVERL